MIAQWEVQVNEIFAISLPEINQNFTASVQPAGINAALNDRLAGQARSEFRDCYPVPHPTPLGGQPATMVRW